MSWDLHKEEETMSKMLFMLRKQFSCFLNQFWRGHSAVAMGDLTLVLKRLKGKQDVLYNGT